MAKAQQHLLLAALVAFVLLAACSAATTPANTSSTLGATATVYDVLAKNNIPRGFLPKGVQSYALTPEGKLDVALPTGCDVIVKTDVIKDYKMQFAADISCLIQPGSISQLHGLSVQGKPFASPFVWLGVNRVERAGNQITLTIQHTYKMSVPVSNFAQSPSCR